MKQSLLFVVLGTGFTFFMTALGSAVVFLFKRQISEKVQRLFLGFAAGVMMSASIWSLLIPALENTKNLGKWSFVPATLGFFVGGVFIYVMDIIFKRLKSIMQNENALMITAVTIHNIPEGMSVGAAFAMAGLCGDRNMLYAATVFAFGIGIQNFPEGAAISLPLRSEGLSRIRSFVIGALTGIVEPIFGIMTVAISSQIEVYMPWMLSFAAGAMIYVVVDELIPKANENDTFGTGAVIAGFLIMMILDVAMG